VVVRVALFAVIETTEFTIDVRYHYASRMMLVAIAAIGTTRLYHRARRWSRPAKPDGADDAPVPIEPVSADGLPAPSAS
jgi:hypothetical protein